METKTYLVNTAWDHFKKDLKQIDNNPITIQFKIMDKYSVIEIIGKKNGLSFEEFKHQIICNKNQNIQVLSNINDQVEKENEPINANVDRVHFDQVFNKDYQLGLHGQLDLEDLISEKGGQ